MIEKSRFPVYINAIRNSWECAVTKQANRTMLFSIAGLTFILPCVLSCLLTTAGPSADSAFFRTGNAVCAVDFEHPDEAFLVIQSFSRGAKSSRFSSQTRAFPHWCSSWDNVLPEFHSQNSSLFQQIPWYSSAFTAVANPVRAGPAAV